MAANTTMVHVRVDVNVTPTIHAHVMVPHEAVRKRVGAKHEESEPPASKPANHDDATAPSPTPAAAS